MNFVLCCNITARCNENCMYCHRFLSPKDLTREENFKILNNIMTSGIKNVTFTGGEALLMPYLSELILFCSENDIKSKLITNGILFTDKFFNQIKNSLNYINLSLDSISIGFAGSTIGVNSLIFPLLTSIFQVAFLNSGKFFGKTISKITKLPNNIWNIISGCILILLGLSKII